MNSNPTITIQGIIEKKENSLFIDNYKVSIKETLHIGNHSPSGFSWGQHGSGNLQVSIAVLLRMFPRANEELIKEKYKLFSEKYTSAWGVGPFVVTLDKKAVANRLQIPFEQ